MNGPLVDHLAKEIQELHHRLVVNVGNLGDEVVIYVKYQAGALKVYRDIPEEYKGFKVVKEGLKKKVYI